MRFGKSAAEAEREPSRTGGGGDFIRYLRDGDNTMRVLQEPDDWTYYWEHFSPAGFSFACNNEEDCPGCASDNEKMKKVNRKIAFNVLTSFNGTDYVNVYKVGPTVADKLKNRYSRFTTITDRDYTITKYKGSGDRYDFDVEGGTPAPINVSKYELKDIEAMLAEQWDEHWGDPVSAQLNHSQTRQVGRQASTETQVAEKVRGLSVTKSEVKPEDPPSKPAPAQRAEQEVKEEDLRRMDYAEILELVRTEVGQTPPEDADTTAKVVDWLMATQV